MKIIFQKCISNLSSPYMHVEMLEYFGTILVPGNLWPGIALGHTQKGYFVAQNIFIIKVRGLQNFGSLKVGFSFWFSQISWLDT